jgi:hypothetical protein
MSGLDGERGRNRTFNLLIKSQLLCQLSYAPFAFGVEKRGITEDLFSVTQEKRRQLSHCFTNGIETL